MESLISLFPPQVCFIFFIAGISPRIKVLDTNSRICPNCGLAQAYLQRVDSYLTLFFVPILRVKKGASFIGCNRCESVSSDPDAPFSSVSGKTSYPCKSCGRLLEQRFSYCPYCGKRI